MSGGSWDYIYRKLEDLSERLEKEACPLRRELSHKVLLIANAMHDIEWVDSFDFGEGEEIESIKIALGKNNELENDDR